MTKLNINQPHTDRLPEKPRILVAPLDWGLGHATRCIPIIHELLAQDVEVWLAGEGIQKELLQQEFPDLPFLPLAGYRIKYAPSGIGLLLNILLQIRKINSNIKKENEWLRKMIPEYRFDGVISDNRYGLYNPSATCVFITHQLMIKSPLGKWTERILQRRNYKYINRFTECWVPDTKDSNNLAGVLSHPQKKPSVPVYYMGHLSRFQITNESAKNNHLLIILSGPEPQRSILENKIIQEIAHYPSTATIVRGLPGSDSLIPSTGMIKFYNHLPAAELNKEMEQAAYIISRSGYSTVMDLVKLKKKSILIPTPGQTEQEYLADYLSKKEIAFCISQKEFSLTAALKSAADFPYHFPSFSPEQTLTELISKLIVAIKKK
jgi:uncharacterized protein (TIGR00661 family)